MRLTRAVLCRGRAGGRIVGMSAERIIANLLRIARDDLKGARVLNAHGNRSGLFLCEHAAGKLMRAVLTSETLDMPIGGTLQDMIGLVPDANPMKPQLRELQRIGAYAASFRAPTPGQLPADPPRKNVEAIAEIIEVALHQ